MTGLELMGIFLCVILFCIVLFWIIWVTVGLFQIDNNYAELRLRIQALENHALTSSILTKKKKNEDH